MGLFTSPEFWGALAVAGIGYVIVLIRTAINQQQTLAVERMRDTIVGEIQLLLKTYDDKMRLIGRELREIRELRRKDNLALAKILTSCPCCPSSQDAHAFDRHPYESGDEGID